MQPKALKQWTIAGCFCTLLWVCTGAWAQETAPKPEQATERIATVWLTDGSSITGQIVEVTPEGGFSLMASWGALTTIPYEAVRKIQYHKSKSLKKLQKTQRLSEYIIRLDDGNTLGNAMIDSLEDDSVSVRLLGGSLLRLSIHDIEFRKGQGFWDFEETGWYLSAQFGLIWSEHSWDGSLYAQGISLQVINGIKYRKNLGLGIGVGLDTYDMLRAAPVFANINYWPVRGKIMPVLLAGYGRAVAWSPDERIEQTNGGQFFQAGIGMQVNGPRHAFVMQLSYRQQNITTTYNEWWWGGGGAEVEELRKHRNIVVSVGMSF